VRCVIFAAVSSTPQVEKASIPTQIAVAHQFIENRGWQEVHPPLVVSGQSRHIDFLHEAIEEIDAIAQLIKLARDGQIDLVIVRDYDRLARTRALLAQISTYLNRCLVQIYALDKPVEPQPPNLLSRGGQAMTGATVEAFAGLEAEREVDRLRSRRRFGMNAIARQGKWKNAYSPYGYTRKVSGSDTLLDVPVLIPHEVELIKRMERRLLRGLSIKSIADELNADPHSAAPRRSQRWGTSSVGDVLRNPFYAGYLFWGLKRSRRVYDAQKGSFVTKGQWVTAYTELRDGLGHRPALHELLAAKELLEADGVIIAIGAHEPLRTLERQRQIDEELFSRWTVGGRAASLKVSRVRVFAGLLYCIACGSLMTPNFYRKKDKMYYCCLGHKRGTCDVTRWANEDKVYKDVRVVFNALADDPQQLALHLQRQSAHKLSDLKKDQVAVQSSLGALENRRARWDAAYEGGVIDLAGYSEKLTQIEQERDELTQRLARLNQALSRSQDDETRRQRIEQAAHETPSLNDSNRAQVKVHIRQLVDKIFIKNGKVEKIRFR